MRKGWKKGVENPAVGDAVGVGDVAVTREQPPPREPPPAVPKRAGKRCPEPIGTIPKKSCPMCPPPARPGAKNARLVAKGRGKRNRDESRVVIATRGHVPPRVAKRVPGKPGLVKGVRAMPLPETPRPEIPAPERVPLAQDANLGTKRLPDGLNVPRDPNVSNERRVDLSKKTMSTKWPRRVAAAVAGGVAAARVPKIGMTPTSNRLKIGWASTRPSRTKPTKKKRLVPAWIWKTFPPGKRPFPTC